jgi:hypothetical protein
VQRPGHKKSGRPAKWQHAENQLISDNGPGLLQEKSCRGDLDSSFCGLIALEPSEKIGQALTPLLQKADAFSLPVGKGEAVVVKTQYG